jgi:ketosteroid isomerase-like protein
MSAEENMALARRFLQARVKGDVDAVDEMLAPDYVSHTTQNPGQASRDRPYSGCGTRGTREDAFAMVWAKGHALPFEEAIRDILGNGVQR